MARVDLSDVTKQFGDVVAVNQVTLSAEDKEFLVLVGPSGSGKTTTLRLVAGLEDVSSGIISIGDRIVNTVSPKDRDIAMVFQSYALYPHMNVYNNMAFGLKLRRTPKAEIRRRVHEAARTLEIESLLSRKPKELSGGQKQRVALGRAIVREPAVFLMDEPLSNLDATLRVQTRKELITLHRRLQATVIYVTHDQTEAMTMGSRIAVMNDGTVQQADTPQALYDRPNNTFVATFIGSPQMNVIAGEIAKTDGSAVVRTGDLDIPLPARLTSLIDNANSRNILVGIRPEHIEISHGSGGNGAPEVPALVDVVEHLGAEIYAYLKAGKHTTLTARFGARVGLQSGATIRVRLDSSRLHLFNAETGDAIGHGEDVSS